MTNEQETGKTKREGHRHLPHLPSFRDNPIVFFTFVTHERRRILDNNTAAAVFHEIFDRSSNLDGWYIGYYLLMPDHVHFFARPSLKAKELRLEVKLWKSVSSRKLLKELHLQSPVWQADYFDRFLRTSESYSEKWDYVDRNPVRAGLVKDPDKWPYKGKIHDLMF